VPLFDHASGTSHITTGRITLHFLMNVRLVRQLVDAHIRVGEREDDDGAVFIPGIPAQR